MRKFKKILAVMAAATLAMGTLSLAACAGEFETPTGIPTGDVSSNGGFVVSIGDNSTGYYYFINGVETYSSDNTYGTPVKGSLQRVLKADVLKGKTDSVETVIPSLMVAGDYTAGIFLYGDRVYYATPTNVRNTSGVVENTYLDFKSAKLDGSDIQDLFRLSSNTTPYRFVQVESTVYCIYAEGSSTYTLHSFNTAAKTDVVLASNVGAYVFDSGDKTNSTVYYTMSVTEKADSDGPISQNYTQVYRVRADATAAPYEYKWDKDWLDENNDGEVPYTNLGTIVLDGIGKNQFDGEAESQFTHSTVAPTSPVGYTYTLRSYKDGGLYFTSAQVGAGNSGNLYFLDEEKITANWDKEKSVSVNDSTDLLVKIANSNDAESKATDTAFFYEEGGTHHYLYVADSSIYRVDVGANGTIEESLRVAYDVGTATIVDIDATSSYHYVYYTRSSGNGLSVERAVYNGTVEDYRNLTLDGDTDKQAYEPVKLLDVQHASGWYNFEVLDNIVFVADSETVGGTAYNYTTAVRLRKADGSLMNNIEMKELNEKYEAITSTDAAKGLFGKLNDVYSNIDEAVKYYFYTGESELFQENIDEAVALGQKETSLYSEEEQDIFKNYVEGKEYKTKEGKVLFAAGERTFRSDFLLRLGTMSEADEDAYMTYWKTSALKQYVEPTVEEEGLAWWAWLLIGLAIAIVVAAAVCGGYFFVRARKQQAPKEEKLKVVTEDDKDIDVYAVDEPEEGENPEPEEPEEELEAEPEEEPEGEPEEEPEGEPEPPESGNNA